jgi:hypothetical protein
MDAGPLTPRYLPSVRVRVAAAAANLVRRLCLTGSSRPTDYRAPGDDVVETSMEKAASSMTTTPAARLSGWR